MVVMGRFSGILMDHFTSPRNSCAMESPDATGHAGSPGRGPFLIVYPRISDGRIVAAKFQAFGCGPTIARGPVLTELITGRPILDCLKLTPEELSSALDGIPADKLHSPVLAIAALHDALRSHTPADWAGIQPRRIVSRIDPRREGDKLLRELQTDFRSGRCKILLPNSR